MSTVALAQSTDCACCSEAHRSFDFWVGEWEVTDNTGKLVGNNTIAKVQDGCVLQENWKNVSGKVTGTSLNFYNRNTGMWEQLWVDNSGSVLKLVGNRTGNEMILSSEDFKHSDGNTYQNRITWTKNTDGTVRQLWEIVKDQEVISVLFDGLYKRI